MIELRTLGGWVLRTGDGRELRSVLAQPKRLALLAYLTLARPRGAQRRDTLLALFWPEGDERHARWALNQALAFLRNALGPDAMLARLDGQVEVDRHYLRCDAVEFDELVERGELQAALELYRGDLLEGLLVSEAPGFERWLDEERTRMRERAARAASLLADRDEGAGRLSGAAQWARRARSLAPYDEAVLRRLLSLLDRLGDRAGAIHQYERFERRLAEDLEVKPSPETTSLMETIRNREKASALATELAARGGATPPVRTSVAVLPFVFLSELEGSKALSLGFADALITMLGNLEDIVVLPTSAILNYAPGTDPAEAGREFGVRHVLQGHIQRAGANWRVSIQLFDSADQKIAFSEKYDFTLNDVFEVQDAIGRRVVETLQSRFAPAAPRSRDRYGEDPEAYEAFMCGLEESYSDRSETLESAARHLTRALERDPRFALAHATLSSVCMNLHFSFDPRRVWLERAEHHCQEALRLDPALPEAHFARAYILWSPAKNFQHIEAIEALAQVLERQPNFERAHNRLGTICFHIGRLEEARTAYELGGRSNPKLSVSRNLNFVHLYSGDFARALEGGEAWIQASPGNRVALTFRPQVALLSGDLELAEERVAEALQHFPDEPFVLALHGLLHARRNQAQPAMDCVRRALDAPQSFGHAHHTSYQIASIYAVLEKPDKAIAWLEKSVNTGFACWPFFRMDPHLGGLRGEPDFQRLLADLERQYGSLSIKRL